MAETEGNAVDFGAGWMVAGLVGRGAGGVGRELRVRGSERFGLGIDCAGRARRGRRAHVGSGHGRRTATEVPRKYGAMAYDAIRHETVLFVPAGCGRTCPGSPSQTWVFDGASRRWSRKFPATNPPLIDGSAAFDPSDGVVVLVGGADDFYSCNADDPAQMWTWDGQNWTRQHPTTSPGRCSGNEMAYDALRHRLVLLTDDFTFLTDETWLWDGTNWTDAGPGPESGSTIAY